jgi:phosphoribosylformylglycinamidine synthase PurS subunit
MSERAGRFIAKIIVTPRKSILDPQGKTIQHSLQSLGLSQVQSVRMGKYIEMRIEAEDRERAETLAKQACERLLANPVMEDFSLTVEEV